VRPSDIALAFSPDGTRLAFSSAAGLETTPVSRVSRRKLVLPPNSFTPDGSLVAVDGVGSITLVPTDGGAGRALTQRRPGGYDFAPLVSPDGRSVAFARVPDRGVADVFVVGIDGTGFRRLTTTQIPPLGTPKVGTTPLAWSPDGTQLLVSRHDRFATVDVETRVVTPLRRTGVRSAIATARWVGAPG
jgi:WD40-like Beta Propeller Repeat